jgi:hypothetical protein
MMTLHRKWKLSVHNFSMIPTLKTNKTWYSNRQKSLLQWHPSSFHLRPRRFTTDSSVRLLFVSIHPNIRQRLHHPLPYRLPQSCKSTPITFIIQYLLRRLSTSRYLSFLRPCHPRFEVRPSPYHHHTLYELKQQKKVSNGTSMPSCKGYRL